MGSGWNLPPGCYERDLPGNTPEDEAFDAFLDSEECERLGSDATDEQLSAAYDQWKRSQRRWDAED
jgi:hypothetical protein